MRSILQILALLFILSFIMFSCKSGSDASGLQNIKVEQLSKLKVDYPDLVIIDVRTPKEIAGGKIDENALEIDFKNSSFDSKISKLDKDKTYLIYCKSGGRSSKSAKKMISSGFKNIYNLDGGYSDWSSSKN